MSAPSLFHPDPLPQVGFAGSLSFTFYWAAQLTKPPGWTLQPGRQDHAVLWLITDGCLQLQIPAGAVDCGPGTLVFFPPGTSPQATTPTTLPASRYALSFTVVVGSCRISPTPDNMPKFSPTVSFDVGTLAPSLNFIYDMEVYRFWVRDDWEEVLAHDEAGQVTGGCFTDLQAAQAQGREIKVGVRDLCVDLGAGPGHKVFTHLGSSFVHTARHTFEVLSHPLVRLAPAIPLVYGSGQWDVSWVFLRTDGFAVRRTLNPYTRTFSDHELRLACRWFVC